MRSLGQPEVLRSASIAALLTALVCYPRFRLAPPQPYPIWYLESVLFLGGIVLWGFVFAWHTKYSGYPVFTRSISPALFCLTTALGVVVASGLYLWQDPILRARAPEEYPADLRHWLARLLFALAFSQLFLTFAPFAWLMRLTRRKGLASVLTVLFAVFVLLVQRRALPPSTVMLFWGPLLTRVVVSSLALFCFLRGGVLLVWWLGLLLQSRHLITLLGHP